MYETMLIGLTLLILSLSLSLSPHTIHSWLCCVLIWNWVLLRSCNKCHRLRQDFLLSNQIPILPILWIPACLGTRDIGFQSKLYTTKNKLDAQFSEIGKKVKLPMCVWVLAISFKWPIYWNFVPCSVKFNDAKLVSGSPVPTGRGREFWGIK